MSSTEFNDLDILDRAIRHQHRLVQIDKQAVERLLKTSFRDELIVERFNEQVHLRGVNRAVAIAEGRDDLPRAMWFGRLNGGKLFSRAARVQAEASVAALPDAMAKLEREQDKLRDLQAARDELARQLGHAPERTREHTRDRQHNHAQVRGTGRSRPRE
jgi:hypothetical protein